MQISQEMVLGSSDEEVIYLEAQGPPPEREPRGRGRRRGRGRSRSRGQGSGACRQQGM